MLRPRPSTSLPTHLFLIPPHFQATCESGQLGCHSRSPSRLLVHLHPGQPITTSPPWSPRLHFRVLSNSVGRAFNKKQIETGSTSMAPAHAWNIIQTLTIQNAVQRWFSNLLHGGVTAGAFRMKMPVPPPCRQVLINWLWHGGAVGVCFSADPGEQHWLTWDRTGHAGARAPPTPTE